MRVKESDREGESKSWAATRKCDERQWAEEEQKPKIKKKIATKMKMKNKFASPTSQTICTL